MTISSTTTQVRERTLAKARTLIEALPFMREHRGAVVVVTARGAILERERLIRSFGEDLALLEHAGVRPLVVVPGASTEDLVGAMHANGVRAEGLEGGGGRLVTMHPPSDDVEIANEDVDLLRTTMADGVVPLVPTVAADPAGAILEVNADAMAAGLAIALSASKLVSLDDGPGVIGPAGDLLSELGVQSVLDLLAVDGAVHDEIAIKLEHAIRALKAGVGRVHLLDGRVEHALVLELFTPEGIGTMIGPDAGTEP